MSTAKNTKETKINLDNLSLAEIKEIFKQKLEAEEKKLVTKGKEIKEKIEALMKLFDYTDYSVFTKDINKLFKPVSESAGSGRGHKLSDDKKKAIKEDLQKAHDAKNGKGNIADIKTGAAIAQKHGVSLPTVQTIKNSMGLVAA